jgi:MFS family permease
MPFVMIAVLIDMVSIGLIVPVLPLLVGAYTKSPAEQSFWYGVVALAFGSANFFASPVLGALSDAHGRRPVMLLGFAALALTFFATALATELWMLIVARAIGGAMQANVSVAHAYVADITPPEDRARRFGMLGAMFGIGFILGPVLGGLLGAIRLQLPFFVAGSLAIANLGLRRAGRARVPGAAGSARVRLGQCDAAGFTSGADSARRRGRPGRGDRAQRPRPVRDLHDLGALLEVQVRLGARVRTAGRSRPSASRR